MHPEIWDKKHETARKVRNLMVGKSFGQGQNKMTEPLGKGWASALIIYNNNVIIYNGDIINYN